MFISKKKNCCSILKAEMLVSEGGGELELLGHAVTIKTRVDGVKTTGHCFNLVEAHKGLV